MRFQSRVKVQLISGEVENLQYGSVSEQARLDAADPVGVEVELVDVGIGRQDVLCEVLEEVVGQVECLDVRWKLGWDTC